MKHILDKYAPYDLLWATVKFDELIQSVYQNLLLIEQGRWEKPLCESTEQEAKLYESRRAWLFQQEVVDEDCLRRQVLDLVIGGN